MENHALIVALDVPSAREAAEAVVRIGDAVSFYKVGLELFLADGPETLRMLRAEGKRVFLDLKLHDIPRTVERAVGSCLRWEPDLLTIHAQGSVAMVEAAARAVREAGAATKILAVTVLTSLDRSDLDLLGVARPVEEQVLALGRLAVGAGAHGLVCSPREAGALRAALWTRRREPGLYSMRDVLGLALCFYPPPRPRRAANMKKKRRQKTWKTRRKDPSC